MPEVNGLDILQVMYLLITVDSHGLKMKVGIQNPLPFQICPGEYLQGNLPSNIFNTVRFS